MKDVNKLKVGDVLSESSHYVVERIIGTNVHLKHHESGQHVSIDKDYVGAFLNSAGEVIETVEVTKEDKKDGTLGIRSIFDNIHSGQVFTVCFKKQDKPRSQKAINADVESIVSRFSQVIDGVKASKKGVADAAKSLVLELVQNPVPTIEVGEDRVLRGYKIQFESRDGRYSCVDMDIERTDKESGIRPVNINTIKWLIFNGAKYIVK